MQIPPVMLPDSAKPARPTRRPKFLKLLAAAGVLGGMLYLAWLYGLPLLTGGREADMPLTTAARRGDLIITVTERGELESIDAVSVFCELGGGVKLMTILPEGTRVAAGDIVAQLDSEQFLKSLSEQQVKNEQAQAQVKSKQSDLTQAKSKAGTEIAKAEKTLKLAKIDLEAYLAEDGEYTKDLEKLKGALELARKELIEAEEELEFTKKQLRKGFGDLTAVKARELNVQQRKFQVASAQAELTLLENYTRKKKIAELEFNALDAELELERTKEAQRSIIEKAENELKSAENTARIEKETLDAIQKQIDSCTIRAPVAGIVVYSNSRYWDESSRIRPGAQLYNRQEIFSLPDLSKMKVKVRIPEASIKRVSVGMSATITLDVLANRVLHGKVERVALLAQTDGWRGGGVKQYETEVSIDDFPSDAGLKPGMTADVKIRVKTIPDALQVPLSAVSDYDGQRVAYVVQGRQIERRVVECGESNETHYEIIRGLSEGEQVALDARNRAAADLKSSGKDGGNTGSPPADPAANTPTAPTAPAAPTSSAANNEP